MKRKFLPWPLTVGAFVLAASGVIVGRSFSSGAETQSLIFSGKSTARKSTTSTQSARSVSSPDSRSKGLPRAHEVSAFAGKQALPTSSNVVPEQEFVAIESSLPGHSLPSRGGVIAVQAFRTVNDATSPELDVVFTPSADAVTETSSPNASQQPPTMIAPAGDSRSGLTYEQELFRTKWGWRAFDQAQRVAAELRAEH